LSKKMWPKPALEGIAAMDRALSILSVFYKGDEAVSLAELVGRTGESASFSIRHGGQRLCL